jgi:hypothetical protein
VYNIKVVHLVIGLVATPLGTKPRQGAPVRITPPDMIQPDEIADELMFVASSPSTCCEFTVLCDVASLTATAAGPVRITTLTSQPVEIAHVDVSDYDQARSGPRILRQSML